MLALGQPEEGREVAFVASENGYGDAKDVVKVKR